MNIPNELKAVLNKTENAIAYDIPEDYDSACIAECCLDCMDMHGGTKEEVAVARAQVQALIKEHGYPALLDALAPLVSL